MAVQAVLYRWNAGRGNGIPVFLRLGIRRPRWINVNSLIWRALRHHDEHQNQVKVLRTISPDMITELRSHCRRNPKGYI
jgi:hypothetical protein